MKNRGKIIAVCNDSIKGTMGEKVLWQFLLENIPNVYPIDKKILKKDKNFEKEAKKYMDTYYPETKIIIQNASFMGMVDRSKFTILFIQDNLRLMEKNSNQQENNLKHGNILVTNSVEIIKSYDEYKFEYIPVGVDHRLFNSLNKKKVKEELRLMDKNKIGIYVGDFSEVKGWTKIRNIIDNHPEIFWIVVSKQDGGLKVNNSKIYIRISQRKLMKLINASDFFILGSPVETQCLSAIEANLCGIPTIMNNTGIYKYISLKDKDELGFFDGNFENNILEVYEKPFKKTRNIIISQGITVEETMCKWRKLINETLTLIN